MAGSLASKFLATVALCAAAIAAPTGGDQIVFETDADLTRVHEELFNAQVIPTVLEEFQPILGLSAEWSSSDVADLGNTLKPANLQSAPSVSLVKGSSMSRSFITTTYVLTLTDPDAPTRDNPIWSEFCHWIATSSSPTISVGIDPEHLNDVVEYKPPGPPPKTEKLHLSKPEERKHWGGEEGRGVQKWAKENGLVAVGANFIYAQNEKQ